MLGRSNITLYRDELERYRGRCATAANIAFDREDYSDAAYWTGAACALETLMLADIPDTAELAAVMLEKSRKDMREAMDGYADVHR
jgi:hypothetical protein